MTREQAEAKKRWAETDWTKRESIITNWPRYIQEQIAMARAKNLSKTVDIEPFDLKIPLTTEYLLRDTRLLLEPNKRHCLYGPHACGKSTLLVAMASGTIKGFPLHMHVHHCEEIEHKPDAESVIDTVVHAHEFRNVLLRCKAKVEELLAGEPSADDKTALKENLEHIEFQLNKVGSATAYDRAAKMLRVLGFDEVGQKKSTNDLSGGLRMRVALCAAFFVEADLLLLDEPTNHLDFPSLLWLENRLRGYRGSFLIISHDRDLLENVCTSVIHIADKRLAYHSMGFVAFEKKIAQLDKKRSDEAEKFIKMNRNVDFSSPKAKEKKEKQDYLEAYTARQILLAGKFTFPAIDPLPAQNDAAGNPIEASQLPIIDMKDVTFSYNVEKGLPFIFKDPTSITINASTRLGVMGPNGAGKSTLLQLLTNRIKPVTGTVTTNQAAKIAYFAQHHIQELNLEQTAVEYMVKQFPEVENSAFLRKHLAKVGISGTIADTRMTALSSGMRSCVIFAKITYRCPHLLIMDEPTNFLDLDSLDSLIAATNKYTGALLLVSHNRRFLLKCAKQYLSVVPGQFNMYNDLKMCEKATYSFIEELEAGGKVGGSALEKKAPSGAKPEEGGLVISSKPAAKTAAAKPAAKAGAPAAKAGAAAPAAKTGAARPESKSVTSTGEKAVEEGHHRSQSQATTHGGGSVRGGRGGGVRGGGNQAPRQPQQNQKHQNNAPNPRPIQQPQSRAAPAPRGSI